MFKSSGSTGARGRLRSPFLSCNRCQWALQQNSCITAALGCTALGSAPPMRWKPMAQPSTEVGSGAPAQGVAVPTEGFFSISRDLYISASPWTLIWLWACLTASLHAPSLAAEGSPGQWCPPRLARTREQPQLQPGVHCSQQIAVGKRHWHPRVVAVICVLSPKNGGPAGLQRTGR